MTSCISTMNVIAQDKKSFTLEDLMPGGNNYFNLQPKNLHGLKWWGDVCVNADIEEVKAVNPTNGKRLFSSPYKTQMTYWQPRNWER